MRYIVLIFLLLATIGKMSGRTEVSIHTPVSINVHQKSLHETLTIIEKQANIIFSYNPQEVNTSRIISLHVEAKPLDVVLKQLLGSTVKFKQNGVYVILLPQDDKVVQEFEILENIIRVKLLESKDSTLFSKKIEHISSGNNELVCHSNVTSKNDEQMKKQITALLLALAATSTISESKAQTEEKNNKPFQISFVYPLGTDGVSTIKKSYNSSFNIIGGLNAGVHGIEFAGVFNKNTGTISGAQFAGVLNLTQHVEGAQFAGISNISKSGNKTAQLAGIANAVKSGETSVQLAGIANASQISTTQAAGIANIADTSTCQIAGITNIARKSKVQVGLVNISEEANVQIGLVNISKNGFMEVEVAGGEFIHASASFRSGTNKFYGIASLGYNFDDEFWAYGVGFGRVVGFGSNIGMNIEGIHYNLATKKFKQKKYNGLVQIRPVFYYKAAKNLKFFAGPVANLYIGNNTTENQLQISAPYTIWDDIDGNNKLEAWVGFTAGIRF